MTAFEQVMAYATGQLQGDDADAVETLLFSDQAHQEAAAWLLALLDALGDLALAGPIVPVLTEVELEALRGERRIFEQHARDNRIETAVPDDRDLIVAHLPIDLHDARRIDVAIGPDDGEPYFVTREAPFDPDAHEIVIVCSVHVARAAGRIRVVVTDEKQQSRGEYLLHAHE